jgi:hypothetical protein
MPAWLEAESQRVIRIMPMSGEQENCIIENVYYDLDGKPERFKTTFRGDEIIVSEASDEDLFKVENRPLYDNHEEENAKAKNNLNEATKEELMALMSKQ